MESLGERFQEWLAWYAPSVIGAVVVLVVGWWAARIIASLVRRLMGRADIDETLTAFAGNLAYLALMALVVITALGQLGVATTSFAAIVGASALAIGFALQGSLANFAAGVMLMLFRPFKVGDFVEAGGVSGVVEEVQVFATKIRTGDNREITVPNGSITSGSIVNNSAKETRRVDLVFGIGYGDDIAKAKSILREIVDGDERVLKDPAVTIAVAELADSSVNLVCRPWVKTGDYGSVRFDVTEQVKLEFDRQQISIPFPQTDVHVHRAA